MARGNSGKQQPQATKEQGQAEAAEDRSAEEQAQAEEQQAESQVHSEDHEQPEATEEQQASADEEVDAPDPEQVEADMRTLLEVAEGRVANVLYPKPDGMSVEGYGHALAGLVERGLAHDGAKPNLTPAGREAARELVAGD